MLALLRFQRQANPLVQTIYGTRNMSQHEKIDYVEFATPDLNKTKSFFTQVFGWTFQDYGDGYTAFDGTAGLTGGFYQAQQVSKWANGSALIVFFSENIQETQKKVEEAGGKIVKPIFEFPGGRRFHFEEPCGNEFAVWALPAEA